MGKPVLQQLWNYRATTWALRIVWGGYAVFLFISTHVPDPDAIVALPEGSDVFAHSSAFFILAVLTAAAFSRWFLSQPWHWWMMAIGLGAWAAADELLQGPFGRTPDIADWWSDLIGVAVGLFVARVLLNPLALTTSAGNRPSGRRDPARPESAEIQAQVRA